MKGSRTSQELMVLVSTIYITQKFLWGKKLITRDSEMAITRNPDVTIKLIFDIS